MLPCHSVYTYNRKKQNKTPPKPPNPVLLNCTIEYLKKRNVNATFTISRLTTVFSYVPTLKGVFYLKLENLGFHIIFEN